MTDVTTLLAGIKTQSRGQADEVQYALAVAVEGVLEIARRAETPEESAFTGPKGSISEWERGFNEGKEAVAEGIRAAVLAALGGGE